MKPKKNRRIAENLVQDAALNYLRGIGFQEVHEEVTLGEKRLDIFARRDDGVFCAIEAKVGAARRAFTQASKYQHVAQKTYVALYAKTSDIAEELAELTGIGLIMVAFSDEGDLIPRLVVEAEESPFFEPSLANYIWAESAKA
jgi:hypothetical protein